MGKMKCVGMTVFIESLRLVCFVGAKAPERNSKQTILVDLRCELSNPDIHEDILSRSVDYSALAKKIRALAQEGEQRKLLETLAAEIGALCFEEEKITRVTVTLRKPQKFADVNAVGVTRIFERTEEEGR